MLNLPDFAPFLNQLAHDLKPLQADRTSSGQNRIYDEFRSQADLGAARQHCGAGVCVFEATSDNRPTDRLADCFDTLECELITANIGGGNILVDGSPLPGFFRWHSDGRATLVPAPKMDADTVPSQPEPNAEEKKLACASYAVNSCEIPRGKFTIDHIDQWLKWIDVAALDQDTLRQIGMALHHYLDGSNTGLRMWHDLCQRSATCEQAAREQEYRQFGSAAERSTINIVHDLAVLGRIKSLNAQVAWRKDSTNSSVYQLVDKQIISVSRGKLLDEYKNSPFPQLTNGTPKLANPIDIWQSHPDRRDAYGTCAENSPEVFIKRPEGGFLLNIFRGLAEPGDAGGCEHFKLFLFEVICSGRQDVSQWIWNWMAWIVQNPTRLPMSAIMLAGSQGTGKNPAEVYAVLRPGVWDVRESRYNRGMVSDSEPYVPFSQRTGLEPIPPQLRLGEVSAELRRLLYYYISLEIDRESHAAYDSAVFKDKWRRVAMDLHVLTTRRS